MKHNPKKKYQVQAWYILNICDHKSYFSQDRTNLDEMKKNKWSISNSVNMVLNSGKHFYDKYDYNKKLKIFIPACLEAYWKVYPKFGLNFYFRTGINNSFFRVICNFKGNHSKFFLVNIAQLLWSYLSKIKTLLWIKAKIYWAMNSNFCTKYGEYRLYHGT